MSDPLEIAENTTYERLLRVAAPDPEAGTFKMTLATEGEAADGHVLSIDGGEISARLPLLVSHMNDPKEAVGSITHARKHLTTSPPRITALGAVELDGDGPGASIRRDLMHMIARNHVNSVSIRWDFDAKDAIRRTDLPKEHPHHVKENEAGSKRFGIYFKRWRALEGSIVALGSDPLALIARSDESEEPVRSFWRSFAADAQPQAKPDPKPPEPAALVAAFAAQAREMLERGVTFDDLLAALSENKPQPEPDLPALLQRLDDLEARLVVAESRRVSGEPSAPRPVELLRTLRADLAQDRAEIFEKYRALFNELRGKVNA